MQEQGNQSQPQPILTATGEPMVGNKETERGHKRKLENSEFVSVIVKRTDETFRHPDDILEKAIGEGLEQIDRPAVSLFLSAVAAGMILCFTVLAVAVMSSLVQSSDLHFGRVVVAAAYPLGFVLCILSRTQLFTEHTATAVYPVLDNKADFSRLLRLWGVVIAGNLTGGLISSGLLVFTEPVLKAADGYQILALHILEFSGSTLFVSAILAGWLMALGAWIVLATHSTLSQIVSIYIVTFIIGLAGFHHSIAGTTELMVAYLSSDSIHFSQLPPVVAILLFGNMVGGSVFVAVLNYGHIRHSQRKDSNPPS